MMKSWQPAARAASSILALVVPGLAHPMFYAIDWSRIGLLFHAWLLPENVRQTVDADFRFLQQKVKCGEFLNRFEQQDHSGKEPNHLGGGAVTEENVKDQQSQPKHGKSLDDRVDLL